MAGILRDERLQIMLSPEELALVDDFRFKYRMPSRAAAVREILKIGLASTAQVTDVTGTKSANFGVFGRGAQGHQTDMGGTDGDT
jgi:hypothetical protein